MTRYIDLCAGQIRVAMNDDGTVTWDGGNAKIDEVTRYLEAYVDRCKESADVGGRMLIRLWSEEVKGS